MALEPKVVAELKEKLLAQKAQLEEELNRIAKPTGEGDFETSFDNIGDDEDENASEVEEYADNLALEDTLEKQLHDVIEALARIDQGTYGTCENCNETIDIERLRAYPAAKTCVKCQK